MSRFPLINNLSDLQPTLARLPELRLMPALEGFQVACYMIAGPETFDSAFARECRGITFAADGTVAGRPLHKFFNVNEREETQVNDLPWDRVARIMDKRDGSMIHTVRDPNHYLGFRLKSKKSFTWEGVADAEAWLCKNGNYDELCKDLVNDGLTAIFEWTAPDRRIVLNYPNPELQLLHIRCNRSGAYFTPEGLRRIAARFHVRLVDEYPLNIWTKEVLLAAAATAKNIEGWVVQFDDHEMVKVKTQWYMDLHSSMTFLRERDIAKLTLAEKVDDLKAKLAGEGVSLAPIIEVETRVLKRIRDIEEAVLSLYVDAIKLPDRKTVAETYNGHLLFGLLMQKYSNKEPNVVEYFTKRHLDEEFTLRQLVLTNESGDAE